MTPENFVYWLHGYFELKRANGEDISDPFLLTIEDHLRLVFEKETPDRSKSNEDLVKEIQEKIREKFPIDSPYRPYEVWPYTKYPSWIPSDWKGPVITC